MRLITLAVVFSFFFGFTSSPAFAQEIPQEIPQIEQKTKSDSNIVMHFVNEQQDMWRAPFRIKRSDLKWLAPLGAGTVALLSTDWKVATAAQRSESLRPASRFVSDFGGWRLSVASASMWAAGKMIGSEK